MRRDDDGNPSTLTDQTQLVLLLGPIGLVSFLGLSDSVDGPLGNVLTAVGMVLSLAFLICAVWLLIRYCRQARLDAE